MSTTAIDIGTLIVSTPETCGGRPRIAGTRISIAQIAVWHQQGMSPEAILEEISYLNLAQIYAALSYYHANRKEIEADSDISNFLNKQWQVYKLSRHCHKVVKYL